MSVFPRPSRAPGAVVATLLCVLALVTIGAQPASAEGVRAKQWYLQAMNIARAHQVSQGAGVTVAVVDSGVDAGHPTLQGSVLDGTNTATGGGNGQRDTDGHGTAMASLVAAHGSGMLGVAPKAKILPVRVSSQRGTSNAYVIAKGVRWAVDHGADVVNVSLAAIQAASITKAVAYAQAHDVVVVAGAGNTTQGDTEVGSPADVPGVIGVSCVGRSGTFSSVSVTGEKIAVAAPCVDIVHADENGGYDTGTGTSDAAALVSGVAALVRAKYPDMSVANVVNRIVKTATDRGSSGDDPKYGYGVVNPVKALTADVPKVSKNPLGTARDKGGPGGLGRPSQGDKETDGTGASGSGDGGSVGGMETFFFAVVGLFVLFLLAVAGLVVFLVLRGRGSKKQASGPPGPGMQQGYGPPPGQVPPGPQGPQPAQGYGQQPPPPGYGQPPQGPPRG